jgi:hypothetical protein
MDGAVFRSEAAIDTAGLVTISTAALGLIAAIFPFKSCKRSFRYSAVPFNAAALIIAKDG